MSDATDYTGPLTYDLLRQAGISDVMVTAVEEREREEAAALAATRSEALQTLRSIGLDPDDRTAVREAFTELRQAYIDTQLGRANAGSELSGADYYGVYDAIRSAYGFVHWPLDWPAPHVAFTSQPLKNLIPRTKRATA